MQYFNFKRLIQKYSRKFNAEIKTEGGYDDEGEYVNGQPKTVRLTGAIINFKESKIYRAEGTLTTQDKRLFMLQPLSNSIIGAIVIDNGNKYRIENESENGMFTGVYAYTLRWVSAFD